MRLATGYVHGRLQRYQSPFAFDTPPTASTAEMKKVFGIFLTVTLSLLFLGIYFIWPLTLFLEEPKSKQVRTLRTPNRDWGKRGGRRGEGRKGKANPEGQKRRDGAYRRGYRGEGRGGEGAGWKRGGKRWLHSGFLTHRRKTGGQGGFELAAPRNRKKDCVAIIYIPYTGMHSG